MTPPDLHEQYNRHVEERGDEAETYTEWLEHLVEDYRDQEFKRKSSKPALLICKAPGGGKRYLFFESHMDAVDVMRELRAVIHTVEVYRYGEKPQVQERLL